MSAQILDTENPESKEPKIEIGTVVYGYCDGVFGGDSYDDKRVIALGEHDGQPWAVLAGLGNWGAKDAIHFADGKEDFELMLQNLEPKVDEHGEWL